MSDGVITQTTLAHRLILKAWKTGGQKMQQQVLWALFQVFFVKTENIGDTQVLANAAVEAGMMGKEEVSAVAIVLHRPFDLFFITGREVPRVGRVLG